MTEAIAADCEGMVEAERAETMTPKNMKRFRAGMAEVFIPVAVLLLLSVSPAHSINSKAGTSGAQFLKLGAGSRAGAMAEAYTAVADDVYALYYNPGALTFLTKPELAAAHTEHFQGIRYEFVGFAYPWERGEDHSKQVIGGASYNLGVSNIERRIDDTDQPIGTFGAGDYAYNVTYARRLKEQLGVGVTGKLIHQTLDSYTASAFALDAGLHYQVRPEAKRPVALAFVIKNIGTKPSFAGVTDPLPAAVVGAVGYKPHPGVKLDLDLTKYRDTDFIFALGGEYKKELAPELSGAFRMGYSTHHKDNEGLDGLTLGVGFNFHRGGFDFAWVPYGALGNTFRYSLHLKF